MTPAQLRAARQMLRWTYRRLATRTGLTAAVLRELETPDRSIDLRSASLLRDVFLAAGLDPQLDRRSTTRLSLAVEGDHLTAQHLLGARGLLNLSSADLAKAAGTPPMALRRFEAGRLSRLSDDSELRLRDSLAALGVVLFSRDDSGPCAAVAFADPFRRPSSLSEETAKLRSQKALSARLAPPDEAISPAQCRAARGLLGWTIRNLAEASNLSTVTINNFEVGRHPLLRRSDDALRRAFAGAGVTLWHAADGSEETVRLVRASVPPEEEPERGGAT